MRNTVPLVVLYARKIETLGDGSPDLSWPFMHAGRKPWVRETLPPRGPFYAEEGHPGGWETLIPRGLYFYARRKGTLGTRNTAPLVALFTRRKDTRGDGKP